MSEEKNSGESEHVVRRLHRTAATPEVTECNGVVTIKLAQRILSESEESDDFDFVLWSLWESGYRKFTLDFSNTTYFGTSGIAPLVSLQRRVRQENGSLELNNMCHVVYRIFKIIGLHSLFTFNNVEVDAQTGEVEQLPQIFTDLQHRSMQELLDESRPEDNEWMPPDDTD